MSEYDEFSLKKGQGKLNNDLNSFLEEFKKYAETKIEKQQIKSIVFFDTPTTQIEKNDVATEQVHQLTDRQTLTEARLDRLEFQMNIMPFKDKVGKIRDFISKTYSDMHGLKTVAFQPTGTGIRVITIHELDNRVEALNQLQKRFFLVEDAFAGIYFEQVVIPISQLEPLILKNAEIIIQN